jgi:hypothetical protein
MTRFCINATWDDVPHLTEEQKSGLWASYPAHMRRARAQGLPLLGSGVIFPIDDEEITVEPFKISRYWPRLGAMDFGYDHPFGAVEIAYDDAADIVYIVQAFRMSGGTPIQHAAALKPWGKWLPWVWPHDGLQHDKGSGDQLAKQYEDHGLNMMGSRVTFPDGTNGVEAGLMLMLDRMQTGRLKVFSHLAEWFAEKRSYHRKDGKVVKLRDDLMSATRYGVMGLRHALVMPELRSGSRDAVNPLGSDPLEAF